MPELPEVENIVRRVGKPLIGCTIVGVVIRWRRTIDRPGTQAFKTRLLGKRIRSVFRRGKYIVFAVGSELQEEKRSASEEFLIGHMRMSGRLELIPATAPLNKHIRLAFELDNGLKLCFNNQRKFGRFYLVSDLEQILGDLGPEPLDPAFRRSTFSHLIGSRGGAIKPLLLNQRFLAGVGNIYADEALWRAGIHPLRKASSLSDQEIGNLYRSIRSVLRRAIRDQGTDAGDGIVEGDYQPLVYGRNDEPCRRCKSPIEKIVVGQRGTHICPVCQEAS